MMCGSPSLRWVLAGAVLAAWTHLSLFPTPVLADGVDIALLPAVAEVEPEEVFDIELTITVPDDSLNGYETRVVYDPTMLTFLERSPISLQEGPLMTEACPNRWHLFSASANMLSVSHVILCAGVKTAGPGVLYRFRFQARDTTGTTPVVFEHLEVYDSGLYVRPVTRHDAEVRIGSTAGVGAGSTADRAGVLQPPSPNPFRAETRLSFRLVEGGAVQLAIFGVDGRLVRTLLESDVSAGTLVERRWDGRDGSGRPIAAGIYLVRLREPAGIHVSRVVMAP